MDKKAMKRAKKAAKYGIPIAALGAGGYMASKAMRKHHGFGGHPGYSSSSSGSGSDSD